MGAGIDEDTARNLQRGRETLGSMLRSAQKNGQKVFIVWILGLLGTIIALNNFLWDALRNDLVGDGGQMSEFIQENTKIITITPFDVPLLQVKIGAVVGILLVLPMVIYYARGYLLERGNLPDSGVARWKVGALILVSLLLFTGGVLYGYFLFFPIMFNFLASNATQAGFLPHYSIVLWIEFIVLLAISFGLAAQLPLTMSVLSYTEIVPYETFRDRWKWAVVAIFVFGALFSPPDPFTQVMWATPLVGLYVVSLGISRFVVLMKRAGDEVDSTAVARKRWNTLAGVAVLSAGLVYSVLLSDVVGLTFPGLTPTASAVIVATVVALITVLLVLYYYVIKELDVAASEAGHFGDPEEIDIEPLTAEAVRAAPPEVFEEMDENEALRLADAAMKDDDAEKAQTILDRFDQVRELSEGSEDADGEDTEDEAGVVTSTTAGVVNAFTEDETTEDDIGGLYYDLAFVMNSLTSKAFWLVGTFMIVTGLTFFFLYSGIPGVASAAVTENATVTFENGTTMNGIVVGTNVTLVGDVSLPDQNISTSDDNRTVAKNATLIAKGGSVSVRPSTAEVRNVHDTHFHASVWYPNQTTGERINVTRNGTVYVQNKPTLGATSGIGLIKNAFVSELPPDLREEVAFITLHPVEHLIFIVKFSVILGAMTTIPILLYMAWPALSERGLARGDRGVLGIWGGSVILTLIVGTLFGFLFVAPQVLSWLAGDVLNNGMEISYRVSEFGWLVLLFTVGIGVLIEIPVTMFLFHKGGIVTFDQIKGRWRVVTLAVFVLSAVLTPSSVFTQFMVAVPVTLFFLLGMGILWLYTLGGRRQPGSASEPAD